MYIYTLGLLSMRQDPSMSMSCCEVSAVSPGVTSILVVRMSTLQSASSGQGPFSF